MEILLVTVSFSINEFRKLNATHCSQKHSKKCHETYNSVLSVIVSFSEDWISQQYTNFLEIWQNVFRTKACLQAEYLRECAIGYLTTYSLLSDHSMVFLAGFYFNADPIDTNFQSTAVWLFWLQNLFFFYNWKSNFTTVIFF